MIPRLIHTFWTSDSGDNVPLPADVVANLATWTAHHPGVDLRIWDGRSAVELGVADLLDIAKFPAMKSDIVRLAAVHKFGGVWSDLKNRCVSPFLDDLLDCQVFVADHPPTVDRAKTQAYLCNAFFGAAAGDDFMAACLAEVRSLVGGRSRKYDGVYAITGPGMMDRMFHRYLAKNPSWRFRRVPRDWLWPNRLTRTAASYNAGGRHWRERQSVEDVYN